MLKINIREFKAHLSAFMARVEHGETLIVAKRNEAIAELRPVPRRTSRRILGKPVKGLHVPRAFFDALPDDVLASFGEQEAT